MKDLKEYRSKILGIIENSSPELATDDIMELMEEAVHQALDEAAEKAKVRKMQFAEWMRYRSTDSEHPYTVDVDSILSLKEKYQ